MLSHNDILAAGRKSARDEAASEFCAVRKWTLRSAEMDNWGQTTINLKSRAIEQKRQIYFPRPAIEIDHYYFHNRNNRGQTTINLKSRAIEQKGRIYFPRPAIEIDHYFHNRTACNK